MIVKAGDIGQGVETSAMRIAGEVAEFLQFAEDGERGIGAECSFEFWRERPELRGK